MSFINQNHGNISIGAAEKAINAVVAITTTSESTVCALALSGLGLVRDIMNVIGAI